MPTVSARGGRGPVAGWNQGAGEGAEELRHRAEGVEGEGHLLYGRINKDKN